MGEQARENYDRARALLLKSARLHADLHDRWRLASVLEALAHCAVGTGDVSGAATLVGTAAAIRDEIGAPVPPCEQVALEETVATVRAQLGDHALGDAVVAGGTMVLDEVVEIAARHA